MVFGTKKQDQIRYPMADIDIPIFSTKRVKNALNGLKSRNHESFAQATAEGDIFEAENF